MALKDYGYMVENGDGFPVLIRFRHGAVETFYPDVEGEWERTPLKDSILNGGGDFVWYDDIPVEDVEYYMDLIRKKWREAGRSVVKNG